MKKNRCNIGLEYSVQEFVELTDKEIEEFKSMDFMEQIDFIDDHLSQDIAEKDDAVGTIFSIVKEV
jgi:hypothetical protein